MLSFRWQSRQGVVAIFGKDSQKRNRQPNTRDQDGKPEAVPIPDSISACEHLVKNIFGHSSDVVAEPFETTRQKAMILYIEGLVDKTFIDRDVIGPLKSEQFDGNISLAVKAVFKEKNDMTLVVQEVLSGYAALFYGSSGTAYILEFRGFDKRAVEEPPAESVIRGPKEGFTESIRTNTAMLRRKLKTPRLIMETYTLGRQSRTTVVLAYLDGIVNREVLQKVKQRLDQIDVDVILESGHIEQYIEENTFSPISGIGLTQKPDVAAHRISEGRIVILCDGTPHVLSIPEMFLENVKTASDYYDRTIYSSFLRILRCFGLLITVMLPGLSVAIITYHQEMIPSAFLTNIISTSQKTPMPVAIEVLLLTIMFELLREAGTRLPKAVGSAITIVGSLIIGDAAVNAGIVSAPIVIIVALTAVTGFMVPSLAEFTIVYRGLYWLLGSTMGIIGIGSATVLMLTQLISTESFGIPILSGFSESERKDGVIRFPLWSLKHRPPTIVKENVQRKA